ncbi:MAG: hypothetical protein LM567_03355 [Desulfurococcaceae archaeon]|nr:hypothetical protein [Desulfurococcaceae archaeon]
MLRDLTYLLVYSEKIQRFGLITRLIIPIVVLYLIFHTRLYSSTLLEEIVGLILILIYEMLIASWIRGFKGVISGLKLYLIFTAISSVVFLVSSLFGMLAPDPTTIPVAALRLVVFFIALTLLFQLISLDEWRTIFEKLGLKTPSELYPLILLQLPLTLYYLSESATAVKLKYKGRRLHRVVVPLILLTAHTSRSILESYVIYGFSSRVKIKLISKYDIIIYITLTILIITILLLHVFQ